MKKSYFPEDGVWLKGNLHSHSTVSDGQYSPIDLAEAYSEHGYDFLSMTDHNVFVPHSELPESEILLLTGVEHDLEYSEGHCTHIVGIGAPAHDKTSYECRRYSKDELADQELIDMMRNDGQYVILAHPVWSRMAPEDILSLENYDAIEVFNSGTEHLCHAGNGEYLWDLLLRHNKRVYGIAEDDVHRTVDLFGGWIWLKAAARTKEAVMDALKNGMFYPTQGPVIYDFGTEGNSVYVQCSECREIHFVTYEPRGISIFAEPGKTLTEASFELKGRELYCRVVCVDESGYSAWTQPIFL